MEWNRAGSRSHSLRNRFLGELLLPLQTQSGAYKEEFSAGQSDSWDQVLQVVQPSRFEELDILVPEVGRRLCHFEDCGIDSKLVSAQEAKHFIAHCLTVFGGVKSVAKVHPTAERSLLQMRRSRNGHCPVAYIARRGPLAMATAMAGLNHAPRRH